MHYISSVLKPLHSLTWGTPPRCLPSSIQHSNCMSPFKLFLLNLSDIFFYLLILNIQSHTVSSSSRHSTWLKPHPLAHPGTATRACGMSSGTPTGGLSGRGARGPLEQQERAAAVLERSVRPAAVEQPAGSAAAVGPEGASLPHAASATFPWALPPTPAATAVQPAAATQTLGRFPPRLHAGRVSSAAFTFERPPYPPPHQFDYPQGDFPGGETSAFLFAISKLLVKITLFFFFCEYKFTFSFLPKLYNSKFYVCKQIN